MYNFDRVFNRRPYDSVKWSSLLSEDGTELLPLWVAEMDFPSPPEVSEAIASRAAHPFFGYATTRDGYFNAFISWMDRRHNTLIYRNSLLFSPGIDPGIAIIIQALTRPGDGVVIQSPVYHSFAQIIHRNGRRVINNRLVLKNGRWEMDLADLNSKIDEKTRMIIICSPHNPVGRVWMREELDAVMEIARRRELVVISDEVHSDIIFPGSSHTCALSLENYVSNVIVFHSPSKTFNIAGLQTAVVVIPNKTLRSTIESQFSAAVLGWPNVFGMRAAEAAWNHGAAWLDDLLIYLEGNKALLNSRLRHNGIGLGVSLVEGSYLAWLDFRSSSIPNPLEIGSIDTYLKRHARLWLDEGTKFGPGGAGFARLNFGCPRSLIEEASSRIVQSLGSCIPSY